MLLHWQLYTHRVICGCFFRLSFVRLTGDFYTQDVAEKHDVLSMV